MRAVVQRVISADASAVNGDVISSIGRGLCVLVGISKDDTKKDIDYIVHKLLNLRFFDESSKNWSKNVRDLRLEILCLSQITLYHTYKGNKLNFHHAMTPALSKDFYREFLNELRSQYEPDLVKEGRFGERIVVGIKNDGPVTVILESPSTSGKGENEEQTVPEMG